MFRRLPTFLSLSFAATVGLFVLTSVLTAQPPTPAKPAPPTPAAQPTPADGPGVKRNQEENLKLFKQFSEDVLRLAQKWEKSDNPEDRERAKSLREVLTLIEKEGVEKLFKELIDGLNKKNLNGSDFNALIGKDKKLMDALEQILTLLDTENETARRKKEMKDLEDAIKAIQELKRQQENLRGRTDNPKSDPNRLAKDQENLAKKTQEVADALNKGGKPNDKPGTGDGGKQDPKAEIKSEPKPGDNTGDAKSDTKENKSENKGDGMGGMPNPMGGDPKPGSGDPKPPMGGDAKPMGGDSKAQGTGKGDSKPSAGQPGGDAKPMGGDGMGGMGGMGQPSPGGSKGGGQPSPGGGQPNPNAPKDPAQENVQQAVPNQQDAGDNIKKGDPKEAAKNQDEAIKKLEAAIAELEKRLKQLREKELAKLLQNLEERVNRMIRMQTEVQLSTKAINDTVKSLGGTPAPGEIRKSQGEAEKEGLIVGEAEKALKLMEGEGTAVVFAGLLKEVKGDMEAIQKRLNEARVGDDTQQIEQDVIDQLKLMLEALKKKREELENKPSDPKPSDPNAKKQDQKLIDLLNELKLIKSLQEQVNKRTIMHNKQDPGEQAKDPIVQAELKQLAERQKVLQDMLHKIATEANQ